MPGGTCRRAGDPEGTAGRGRTRAWGSGGAAAGLTLDLVAGTLCAGEFAVALDLRC